MKLAIVIVHNRDRAKMTDSLLHEGFKFTVIGSTGGFLREGNTTVLIGVEEERVKELEQAVAQNCSSRDQYVNVGSMETAPPAAFVSSPIKVKVGGAIFFLLDVEKFDRF